MSGSHKNVIEINGKLYDAKSGMLLSNIPVKSAQTISPQPLFTIQATRSIDGVQKRPKPKLQRPQPTAIKRAPQKSSTLMRQAVRKPATKPKTAEIKSHTDDPGRAQRASHIQKSPFIKKYGQPVYSGYTKRNDTIAVKQPPTLHTTNTDKLRSQASKSITKPPVKLSKSEQLFNDALAKTSAPAKKPSKHKRKVGSKKLHWGSSIIAAFLLIGFIAYMNMPNINMKIASSRAGFSAAMPSYQPAGFRTGNISYQPGVVTVSFKSNTDNRSYTLNQEVSSWNSQTLQDNFLNSQNKTFRTEQEGGRTIFMYDNGNATWVNGGVWYQVQSSALSSDQLLKIASSL